MSERQRAPLVRRAYEEQVEWLEADGRGGDASLVVLMLLLEVDGGADNARLHLTEEFVVA